MSPRSVLLRIFALCCVWFGTVAPVVSGARDSLLKLVDQEQKRTAAVHDAVRELEQARELGDCNSRALQAGRGLSSCGGSSAAGLSFPFAASLITIFGALILGGGRP